MYYYSSCIPTPMSHIKVTHTQTFHSELFQSNLNHDLRSKILFHTNLDSYSFLSFLFIRFYLIPVTHMSTASAIATLTSQRFLLSASHRSIRASMLTTRLTYERFTYACILSICFQPLTHVTSFDSINSHVSSERIFSIFFFSLSINNITSLIPILILIFNTHNLPTTAIWGFVFLFFFFLIFLPLSTQATRREQKQLWDTLKTQKLMLLGLFPFPFPLFNLIYNSFLMILIFRDFVILSFARFLLLVIFVSYFRFSFSPPVLLSTAK
jgi:hypothetical protein